MPKPFSTMPIVPTDIFPRDLSELLHKKYHRIKTTFDLTCLTTTVLLSLLILHHLYGIGIGTFFCAFMLGRTVALVQKFIGNHVEFYRLTPKNMVTSGKKSAMHNLLNCFFPLDQLLICLATQKLPTLMQWFHVDFRALNRPSLFYAFCSASTSRLISSSLSAIACRVIVSNFSSGQPS